MNKLLYSLIKRLEVTFLQLIFVRTSTYNKIKEKMKNFKYHNPTQLIFGEGMIKELGKQIPIESRILIVFGGGSVKRNGVYDAVMQELKDYTYFEFWGIEANPKVETIRRAVALGKEQKVDFVLAVGGGSVLDASKLIINAIPSERDAWDLVVKGTDRSVSCLPLGTVLTIPATGSEMNSGGVISCEATKEKFPFVTTFPKFSILDPCYTYSLPPYQVACGIADSFIHVMEQYICKAGESPLLDRWAEGILLTLIEQRAAIQEGNNYQARANFMLCATMALNGLIRLGTTQDWATHRIGHELTALTELTHGHTLAIILPALLRVKGFDIKREKMLQYAERIWGITGGNEDERIERAIEETEDFFRSLGLATRLSELSIKEEVSDEIVERFREREVVLGENQDIDYEVIAKILQLCQ